MAASRVQQRLQIRGLVQGVGYRAAMAAQARRLALAGWVRNRRDASVEAVVAGAPEAVDSLVRWARRGPAAARVDSVEVLADSDDLGDRGGFEQRPTV